MNLIERRDVERPLSGEAPFRLQEAFYSRTDSRGVIIAGNFVFQRVSHYSWDELIGAPHKIVRHPDMPKGVFWLFWDTIRRNRPMGAYVKNRAKDGLHYWVFAVAVPCLDGYLSARIKPTSSIFRAVEAEYASLLEVEKAENLAPEESAALFRKRICGMGYDSYDEFASLALGEEVLARDTGLNSEQTLPMVGLRKVFETARQLEETTKELVSDFASIRYAPINMGVVASRVEPTGGPINSLSRNYGLMSREISTWFDTTVVGPESNFATIKTSITESLFLEGMSQILSQCGRQLFDERRQLGSVDMEIERKILNEMVNEYIAQSDAGMSRVKDEAERIAVACKKMHTMVLGLRTTRVLCRVESARLPVASDSLNNIIEQLELHQDRISMRLERIASLSGQIRDFVSRALAGAGKGNARQPHGMY